MVSQRGANPNVYNGLGRLASLVERSGPNPSVYEQYTPTTVGLLGLGDISGIMKYAIPAAIIYFGYTFILGNKRGMKI